MAVVYISLAFNIITLLIGLAMLVFFSRKGAEWWVWFCSSGLFLISAIGIVEDVKIIREHNRKKE